MVPPRRYAPARCSGLADTEWARQPVVTQQHGMTLCFPMPPSEPLSGSVVCSDVMA